MPFGPAISTLGSFILGLVVTGGVFYGLVQYALKNGDKPLPPGEYDDLPSVLKALYMQQRFADFAVDAQARARKSCTSNSAPFWRPIGPATATGQPKAPA